MGSERGSEGRLNVVLDARMIRHTGIGRYIRSLVRQLPLRHPEMALTLLTDPGTPLKSEGRVVQARTVDYPARIYSLREQAVGSWIVAKQRRRADLVHVPHYNAPWLLPRNSVVTIHDLTHFRFNELQPRYRVWASRLVFKRAVRKATHIIAVSDATRLELGAFAPEVQAKCSVIHHGVGAPFGRFAAERIAAFKAARRLGRFLLYVGNRKLHKNIPALLETFEALRERRPGLELVLVGPDNDVEDRNRPGVRVVTAESDDDLAQWYGAAEILVHPSRSEGFGLTCLEAMACGTPVVAFGIPALQELSGDACLLVEPFRIRAFHDAVARVLDQPSRKESMSRAGIARAAGFSWEKAADETCEIYRRVADA
jgi:glycosyltransferase involved in cell wall biosynthesis